MDKTKMSEVDLQAYNQAKSLLALMESEVWVKYLQPFLLNLAQEGYPNPKEYSTNEKLILDYTLKVGETQAVKKFIEFITSQKSVMDELTKKAERVDAYTIA